MRGESGCSIVPGGSVCAGKGGSRARANEVRTPRGGSADVPLSGVPGGAAADKTAHSFGVNQKHSPIRTGTPPSSSYSARGRRTRRRCAFR